MSHHQTYLIPAHIHTTEYEIKRSRFITTVGPSENRQEAMDFIQKAKKKFPDANHHCYAYVAGSPFNTTEMKSSDDGEPVGTAGKPILTILQHRKIGNVVAVVTRYFGGIKLGSGGLVRAYSTALSLCLEHLHVKHCSILLHAEIKMPFSLESAVRRILETMHASIAEVFYHSDVSMIINIPEELQSDLLERLSPLFHCNVRITWKTEKKLMEV